MRIGLAADHAGFELKSHLARVLEQDGHFIVDYGAGEYDQQDDYPDFVIPLARSVAARDVVRGVAVCGSGVGASITANKVAGVRAGLVSDCFTAHQGVEHDDLNLLCLGQRTVGPELAVEIMRTFIGAEFQAEKRFLRRLEKVSALERRPETP
jgi:ribose 5-phosphate isomerase B